MSDFECPYSEVTQDELDPDAGAEFVKACAVIRAKEFRGMMIDADKYGNKCCFTFGAGGPGSSGRVQMRVDDRNQLITSFVRPASVDVNVVEPSPPDVEMATYPAAVLYRSSFAAINASYAKVELMPPDFMRVSMVLDFGAAAKAEVKAMKLLKSQGLTAQTASKKSKKRNRAALGLTKQPKAKTPAPPPKATEPQEEEMAQDAVQEEGGECYEGLGEERAYEEEKAEFEAAEDLEGAVPEVAEEGPAKKRVHFAEPDVDEEEAAAEAEPEAEPEAEEEDEDEDEPLTGKPPSDLKVGPRDVAVTFLIGSVNVLMA